MNNRRAIGLLTLLGLCLAFYAALPAAGQGLPDNAAIILDKLRQIAVRLDVAGG